MLSIYQKCKKKCSTRNHLKNQTCKCHALVLKMIENKWESFASIFFFRTSLKNLNYCKYFKKIDVQSNTKYMCIVQFFQTCTCTLRKFEKLALVLYSSVIWNGSCAGKYNLIIFEM